MERIPDLVHDAQLLRRAASLILADRRALLNWRDTTVATATVDRWISADLRSRAKSAKDRAQELCKTAAKLHAEAVEQRDRWLRGSAAKND